MKILIEESVLRQALEAMLDHGTSYLNHEDEWSSAVGALQVALDAAEKVEPIGYVQRRMRDSFVVSGYETCEKGDYDAVPFFLHPAPKPEK